MSDLPKLHPCHHAAAHPDRAAFVVQDRDQQISYAQLDAASNQFAQYLRAQGLKPGDTIGAMLKNSVELPIVYWAVQRSGLFVTLISTHLKPDDVAYILNDCGAKLLVTTGRIGETVATLADKRGDMIGQVERIFDVEPEPVSGAESFWNVIADMPTTPVADENAGYHVLYSSGTTGRPKGIRHAFETGPIEKLSPAEGGARMYEHFDPLVAFVPGPCYHGAPLAGMLTAHRMGGTVVTMDKFDAETSLAAIEKWRVNVAHMVPTMFVRMLALSDEVRDRYNLSSLRMVMHAGAPCAVDIKRRMIEWLGPVLFEYYAATENVGSTYITSQEWLEKPGSVGKSVGGAIHICAEDGSELPIGETGLIYFEVPAEKVFSYLNKPGKAQELRHPSHENWYAVGDIGKVDADGYLFLTDRKDFMIVSGGVNIYPQMIEDALIVHPKVLDAAVIGIPNPEYGEEVKAIVQPKADATGGDETLASELTTWCKEKISSVYCPRSFQFVEELPRLPSGKLAKHELRRLYGSEKPW